MAGPPLCFLDLLVAGDQPLPVVEGHPAAIGVGLLFQRAQLGAARKNNRWKERKLPLSVSSRKEQKCSPDLGNS